jgi:hypothetical protein
MLLAEASEHKSCYDALFNKYPHEDTSARDDLLTEFASSGLKSGLIHLLSKDYPQSFSEGAIDKAFRAALDAEEYEMFDCFFQEGLSPSEDTLRDAFKALCMYGQFEYIESFMRPDICPYLEGKQVVMLLNTLVFNPANRWEQTLAFLEKTFNSPLFDQLSREELFSFVKKIAAEGDTQFALELLNSRRGGEITQLEFEEIVIEAFKKENEDTISLLDWPMYPIFSGKTLGELLLTAVSTKNVNFIRKVFTKKDPNDPIPRAILVEAFTNAAQQNENIILHEILRNGLQLNLQEVELLIAQSLEDPSNSTTFFLAVQQVALQIAPELVGQVLLRAAIIGAEDLLKKSFVHLRQVDPKLIEQAIYAALRNGHDNSALLLLQKTGYKPDLCSPADLRACLVNVASEGRLKAVEFICNVFLRLSSEDLEFAYETAKLHGRPEVAAAIWHFTWHRDTGRPDPVSDLEPALKRPRLL